MEMGSVIVENGKKVLTMGESELKPCPFFGSDGCYVKKHHNRYYEEWFGVICKKCGAEVCSPLFDTQEDAIQAWNRRVYNG